MWKRNQKSHFSQDKKRVVYFSHQVSLPQNTSLIFFFKKKKKKKKQLVKKKKKKKKKKEKIKFLILEMECADWPCFSRDQQDCEP
jgi:hypothetical protein